MIIIDEKSLEDRTALISVFGTNDPERNWYEMFLYKLLQERKPYQNISHKEMPSYEDHVRFVRENRGKYKEWFLIQKVVPPYDFVGSIYLGPENNVGIFILDNSLRRGYGALALKRLCEYYKNISIINANIAPTNSISLAFFINQGFKYAGKTIEYTDGNLDNPNIIQYTYARINPFYVEKKKKVHV